MDLERNVLSFLVLAHMAQDKGSGVLGRSSRHGDGDGSDVIISVKTGSKYLNTRLPVLLLTWMKTVTPGQVN